MKASVTAASIAGYQQCSEVTVVDILDIVVDRVSCAAHFMSITFDII